MINIQKGKELWPTILNPEGNYKITEKAEHSKKKYILLHAHVVIS